ncbi:carboxypeptidase-like regulatory domain-containing protein [Hymenobacter puniceus]|uniref:carboxypeptidase-like regulatory domain-containing protein n=1 Tax=Hymenobacter sp. BT190 TaxID=2763505 RepID=UPI001650D5BA|nr:carboxypeptidase-like regulatory domain-containing protein [Hymenobacter sp. BT190]MBC6700147.1 carboxypeptidase-like regulatory domain-containing protein [Hymenobacter sp. BT190]
MKLSASPFDSVTGGLLPVYRDAYLRGDLSRQNTTAVDAYLKRNRHLADDTLRRFYDMKGEGEQVRPVGWVHRQLELIRTEPKRFRQRAAALVGSAVLIAGASMAATNLPTEESLPTEATGAVTEAPVEASVASLRMVTVQGRILDENGRPLVGATVLDKATGRGVGTDASGAYSLKLPASSAGKLQFGYGGYADEEIALNGRYVQNVTLVPRDQQEQSTGKSRRRWLFF